VKQTLENCAVVLSQKDLADKSEDEKPGEALVAFKIVHDRES
jgi:hypothetical protein